MPDIVKLLALPIITLLAGLASLLIDPKANPGKKWILVVALVVGAAGSIAVARSDETEKLALRVILTNQSEALTNIKGTTEATLGIVQRFGYGEDLSKIVKTSFSANQLLETLLPVVRQERSQTRAKIMYFPKHVDGPVVIKALQEGGFDVQTMPGKPENNDLATNAIWVGNSISVKDAQFVALTLVRAGVGIVSIRRLRNGTGSRANLIEVGTDRTLLNRQPYTVDEIAGLKDLPPREAGTADELLR